MATTKREEWIGTEFRPYGTNCYRMATVAHHLLGDISRDNPNLCLVRGETPDDYIGAFVTGFGFIDVKFPKATTRKLTPAEADQFRAMRLVIGGTICDPYVVDAGDIEEQSA